jgi:hypothetical protein
MTLASSVTSSQLRKAATIKQRIETLNTALDKLLGYQQPKSASNGTARVMSPEAKQRIIAAQKKRWAAFRKAKKKARK